MKKSGMKQYDVAAYIWPSYHHEPRVENFWPEKDGEWYTVRRGTPRFPGHDMPRIPLLGYQDEADPKVMRQHVELAMAHGVNVFIVDWYWYLNAPCFERQLNEGLIPALKGTDCKFYLMWANHDVNDLWNMHVDTYWHKPTQAIWSGQVNRAELEPMFDRIIEKYLTLDSYYRIGGKPVFSIFGYAGLVTGLGGVAATRDAFDWMRQRCVARGLPGLDIQAIAKSGAGVEAGAKLEAGSEQQVASDLAFDSATAYQYAQDAGETGDYPVWADKAMSQWKGYENTYGTYYPHASIGWDNTHRNPSFSDHCVVKNATPDAFEACLWRAKAWLDARPAQAPLVTINSWNEWTEGSYLLPDMRWGYRYLRAVKNVFGRRIMHTTSSSIRRMIMMATIGVSAAALTGDTASGGTNTSVPVVEAQATDTPIRLEATRVTPPNLPEYLDPFGKPPPCGPGNITDFPISPIMIDGELWIVLKNGYGEPVARYKGTNIETAVRQPDGRMNRTHPVHGTVTHPYILGRLWYDASDKKLYAPMHCESDGYTAGPGIVLRQVHLASSADKGLTWNYEGAILKEAPATAPLADSGLYWNGGDGDFYLYSDEASGYHYLFTTYYLWPKPGVKAPFFMRHRVARCKFSDKMAPGKWQRFYNGGWTEPGIGGKSSYVDAHCVVYNTFLGKYLGFNYGSTVAVCTDLAKQDWSPSYYVPGDCWGTQKNLEITPMDEGKTNPWTCGKTFYVYTYLQGWNGGTGQVYRVDLGVGQPLGAAGFSGWGTGMDAKKFFDPDWEGRPTMDPLRPYGMPSYDSADPIESRRTRTVGCDSPEATYKGTWAGAAPSKASGTAKDSVSLVFKADAIYWRAEQGPDCGKADVYLDGVLQKTVDCFGITSPYKFWFVKTGMDPARQHTITVEVRGDKNAKSIGTAVKHMSFEYAADSTQASLGFCGVMGKNDWYYLAWDGSAYSKLDFDAKENLWRKGGKLAVGHDFMAPDGNTSAVRQWQAPHAGKVRVEGVVSVAGGKGDGVTAAVLHNTETNWPACVVQPGKPLSCDFVVAVTKGDTLSFVVSRNGTTGTDDRALWDPVITFIAP